MKLHLSGKMTGMPDRNEKMFRQAEEAIRRIGHDVFQPHGIPPDTAYREALLLNLRFICEEADGMVMLPGWNESPGARAENATADAVRLPIWQWDPALPGGFAVVNSVAHAFGTLQPSALARAAW